MWRRSEPFRISSCLSRNSSHRSVFSPFLRLRDSLRVMTEMRSGAPSSASVYYSSLPAEYISLFCPLLGHRLWASSTKKSTFSTPRCFLGWLCQEHLSPPLKDPVSRCAPCKCPPMYSSATPSPHASQLRPDSA